MKVTWRGKWGGGIVEIEVETLEELDGILHKLFSLRNTKAGINTSDDFPVLPVGLGIADAIRVLLQTKWGKFAPRSMTEIAAALEVNEVHFTKGTLSGTLRSMTKREELERSKRNGKWIYTINVNTN
jgi:hypothetical protein